MARFKIYQDKSLKRAIGRWGWNFLSSLPMFLRGPILRRLFYVDKFLPDNLIFKKAETDDELQQAFRIAFEAYCDRGLASEKDGPLRVTKYHVLPTTSVLIAKLDEEVIATLSIVCDSNIGLPMENLFDVQPLRKTSKRLAEISTLAIKRSHRGKKGKLFLSLCKFMYEYCVYVLGVDVIAAAVHPEISDFYRCLMFFSDIENGKVATYSFVKGAAARGHYLYLNEETKRRWQRGYRFFTKDRNIYKYFIETKIPNFYLPEKIYNSSTDYTFTPEMLKKFFQQQSDILKSMTEEEKVAASNLYFYPEFQSVFGAFSINKRSGARFAANCPVRYHFIHNKNVFTGTAIEVSRQGIKIRVPKYRIPEETREVIVAIDISESTTVKVYGQIIWDNPEMSYVCIWVRSFAPMAWHRFINYLEADLLMQTQRIKTSFKSQTG
jgi:hypothetical protein